MIVGGDGKLTVMLRFCVADCVGLLVSVTFTMKLAVPSGPLGAPEITPALLIFRPPGSVPALIVNVKGFKPPLT